ncbi:MAG TPA: type II toxin-antitoxin system RelE/ParE family toxin [Verrucomicrobiae bacterium]|nr:type II toxin-antitoxin system RelE/ParE family toxin [Verrucomicrobiae bacterium]
MKPVRWVGGSEKDLETMPDIPRREIRAALLAAENGGKADYAKPMRGDLRDVVEVVAHNRDGTFRGVYYVGKELIYALHFFQKKSKHGIATPKRELELIRRRFAWARRQEREAG